MQQAAGKTAPQVWGQKISTDKNPVLSSDANYKVYPTAKNSPCQGYSNKENDSRDHQYENGVCIYCGKQGIAYTVTIPATVTLGNTATIKADVETLPDDKQLNVKVADAHYKKGRTCSSQILPFYFFYPVYFLISAVSTMNFTLPVSPLCKPLTVW